MVEFVIAAIIIGGLAILAFVKTNLQICNPNEILIFSGRRHKLSDGSEVGYRIIKGGRALKIPIVESVSRMSLETMPIKVEFSGALSKGLIPVHLECMANIKIAGSEADGLFNAVERFLGKSREDIANIARQTLEGSVRGVLATLTPEEANSQRIKFAQEVLKEVHADFKRLGLVLDTFKIQTLTDSQRYLEALGRKKNAEVQKEARIAEAESEAEARRVAAEAKKRGSVAEYESEIAIVEAENKLKIRKAELSGESNKAEARASVAGKIALAEEEKLLEKVRIDLNRSKYEAEVVVPAAAEKEAKELKAKGEAAKILENGKATAEAVRMMRQEWEKGDTRELFMLQQLPDIIDKITRVVADNLSVEKLTVVDAGDGGGIPLVVRNLVGSVVAVMEQMKNAAGLDIPALLQPKTNGKPTS